jgi:putative ABC transport system permease protein
MRLSAGGFQMFDELWSDVRYRVRALLRRDNVERELAEELRFHLEHETEKYERMGLSHAEAERRARVAFGGVERAKEASRDGRGTVLLESILQDLRYAWRGLRSKPAFTLGIVLTLGLGIGANAAMFGIVDRLLFRAPAYLRDAANTHRVYLTWMESGGRTHTERNTEFARYLDFKRWTHDFSLIAAFQTRTLAVGEANEARERPVTVASAAYFDFFDARPVLGRFFSAEEDSVPVGRPVAVLGYTFWQTEFGGRNDVLGKTIRVDRGLLTIIGVAPDGFTGMTDQGVPALYMPITAFAWGMRGRDYSKNYNWGWLELIVRRKPGVSLSDANADLSSAYRRSVIAEWELKHKQVDLAATRPSASLAPVQLGRGPEAGQDAKIVVWVSGVALIVLLVACANVANLLLSRAVKRRREIALRLALGVSRGRLVRQLLTESLVLATLGGIVGLAAAQWGGASLRVIFLPDQPAGVITDARTLGVALVGALGAALLTGLVPALIGSRSDLARSLTGASRDAGAARSRTRTALLVFQAALSVVLLVGAGLFVRSLQNVRAMRLGYDVGPVSIVSTNLRGTKLLPAEATVLGSRMVDAARGVPGVSLVSPVASVPFWSNEGRALYVEGIDSVQQLGRFVLQAGAPEYFRAAGTRILRGRGFDANDVKNAPLVMVIGDGMAKALWPGQDPIGKCIRVSADTAPCTAVVGVAEEMRMRTLDDVREHTYYLPMAQYDDAPSAFLVRVAGDAADYSATIRRALQPLMPGAAYVNVQPLRELVDPRMRGWQFGATMFLAFGGLALALAAVGLYSVIAYGVAQRQKELGVRIALGASRGSVVRLVVRGGVRMVVIGIAIGGIVALWAGHWVEALLFDESPKDPVVYASVAGVLVVVAIVATALPAFSASRVDPNTALRAE